MTLRRKCHRDEGTFRDGEADTAQPRESAIHWRTRLSRRDPVEAAARESVSAAAMQ
jgi:hypothetical protein